MGNRNKPSDNSIQIQHLLKLNIIYICFFLKLLYSNTTLVKVKFILNKSRKMKQLIQIQHLLKLNAYQFSAEPRQFWIQIQHLLKLNYKILPSVCVLKVIQIQHLLKLNWTEFRIEKNSQFIQIQHLLKLNKNFYQSLIFTRRFKYNTC